MLNQKLYQEISKNLDNYYSNKDRNIWRNNFHIEMPFGLVNDPNGLSYYNNKFHIFYQWNPFGCEHKTKHWGLVTTTDFVNFTKPKIVLKPGEWFDQNGCYSGCGLVKDEELKLYYTGNVRGTDNERISYQCVAKYDKDGTVEKQGVVIEKQPDGYTAHFRDPFIFINGEIYYMALGIQNSDLRGRVLIYESKDTVKWDLLGELKTNMQDFGYMWECPNIVKVSKDKYAFIFSPQGLESEELKYQNIFQSGYVIGNLDLKKIELKNHSEFKELDMGFDFYAPQIFSYDNKNIMFGWIGLPDKEHEYPTSNYGWMYSLTIPRVLEYRNNVLYQKPFDKIKNLRHAQILDIKNLICDEYKLNLDSKSIEIILNLKMRKASFIEVKLKFKHEYILLTYDRESQICTIDRSSMQLGGKGIRKFRLEILNELKLHIFVDNSVIEIYYQDGVETTTFMYFPKEDDFEVEINSNYKLKINKLCIWKLGRIKYE